MRSSAASLLATARRCAGRLYEEWRIPHPWLQATVAEHLRGGVPVRACPRGARQRGTVAPEPRSRARRGAGGNRSATPGGEAQSESTPSDWALRVSGQGAMSMPSACATPRSSRLQQCVLLQRRDRPISSQPRTLSVHQRARGGVSRSPSAAQLTSRKRCASQGRSPCQRQARALPPRSSRCQRGLLLRRRNRPISGQPGTFPVHQRAREGGSHCPGSTQLTSRARCASWGRALCQCRARVQPYRASSLQQCVLL